MNLPLVDNTGHGELRRRLSELLGKEIESDWPIRRALWSEVYHLSGEQARKLARDPKRLEMLAITLKLLG